MARYTIDIEETENVVLRKIAKDSYMNTTDLIRHIINIHTGKNIVETTGKPGREKWTDKEENTLILLWEKKKNKQISLGELANRLNRPISSVSNKAVKLGLAERRKNRKKV